MLTCCYLAVGKMKMTSKEEILKVASKNMKKRKSGIEKNLTGLYPGMYKVIRNTAN